MAQTKILHLADLHLGARHTYLGPLAESRQEEADGLLGRVVNFVLAQGSGIGGVLLAGDLFDSHDPPPSLAESVLRDLRRLTATGVRLLTVPGNHDEYSYPQGIYRRLASEWPGTLVQQPNPMRVDRWELDGRAIDLYSMAFTAGRSRAPFDQFEVEPGDARRLAVLHGSLDVGWSDRSIPLRSYHLAELGLDYLALGHIHRPMERRIGRGWACYPGRIEGGGFDDPGGAGLVVIDTAEETLAPVRLSFQSRRIGVEQLSVSALSSERELDTRIEALADPAKIARLVLSGLPGFPLDAERVCARWTSCFYHLEIAHREGIPDLPALEELQEERTVRGLFARIAAERIADARTKERETLQAALRHGLAAFGLGGEEASPGSAGGPVEERP